jgi:DNA-binding NarL/FixJ family response regulator
MKIKILLVDNHKILLDGLRTLIEKQDSFQVIGMVHTGREAVSFVSQHTPNVIIMDISMPDLNGIEATRNILSIHPSCKIIMLSMYSDKGYIAKALSSGARGYLLKDGEFADLVTAIQTVLRNQIYLSPEIQNVVIDDYVEKVVDRFSDSPLTSREREVLQLIAEGKSSKQIADVLFISTRTVEVHRRNILEKLKISSMADLVKYAIREGYTSIE